MLLGGTTPESARGTVDSTLLHALLNTLECRLIRRQRDGPHEHDVSAADIPLTNLTGNIPGPLNAQYYVPFTAPNTSAVGVGGGPVFVASGLDTGFTAASAPAPGNLTAQNASVPWSGPRVTASSSSSNSSTSSGKNSGAVGVREGIVGATVLSALLAGVAALFLA
ncbi:hypothetical protein V8E53_006270 [Lactarius tabidus]